MKTKIKNSCGKLCERKRVHNNTFFFSKQNDTLASYTRFFSFQGKRVKGQMFVIAAIFMILGFVLLRNLLSLPEITQEKVYQDTSYLDKNLRNLEREYSYLAGTASMQPNVNFSGNQYLHSFTQLVRSEFDAKVLYVYIYSNGTSSNVSVTIGNFMKNNMSGVLNITSATPTGRTFSLNDTHNTTLEFNLTAGWLNATLNYTMQNRETVERLYFNASTRNYVLGFTDMTLQERGFLVRFKSTYNRTWIIS
ncbi:MAG: hypothetical protein QT00_C0001G0163 [archaeon GW2011_AR5]|nr:MAG: hypothetical protein QT00_C0001G0163 [archaeon GW2011_AR5]